MSAPYKIQQIDVNNPLFNEVLELRREAYGQEEAGVRESIDEYSTHFVASLGTNVLGALRVTCRNDGPLESEEFYPQWLLDEFGDRMCAASRMCVRTRLQGSSAIPHELTVFGWSFVLSRGVRIDVSKVRLKAIPFYLRMGYYFVRDSVFDFERWNVRCGIICYPADPNNRSSISHVFAGIDNPCNLADSPNAAWFVNSRSECRRVIENNNHVVERMAL